MNIDTGLAVVVVAVLIFYLRLIGMQRERARRAAHALAQPPKKSRKGKAEALPAPRPNYSILSRNRLDRIIAGGGLLAILVGVTLNAGWVALPPLNAYWWVPTALGIVAFSWAFKIQAEPRER
jgi:hypothetical protein